MVIYHISSCLFDIQEKQAREAQPDSEPEEEYEEMPEPAALPSRPPARPPQPTSQRASIPEPDDNTYGDVGGDEQQELYSDVGAPEMQGVAPSTEVCFSILSFHKGSFKRFTVLLECLDNINTKMFL